MRATEESECEKRPERSHPCTLPRSSFIICLKLHPRGLICQGCASNRSEANLAPTMPGEQDYSELVNAHLGGFNLAMGLRFTRATADRVEAVLPVTDALRQPYGLVHGGVYASMIETACSTGAALSAGKAGMSAVGLENTTSFLRAVRSGQLTVRAEPLLQGRRTQVWQAEVLDGENRVAASGRVRLIALEAGAKAGGESIELKQD